MVKRTSDAAPAALIDIARFCMRRQRTAHRTVFTPFTLMLASAVYVLRCTLSMYERKTDENMK